MPPSSEQRRQRILDAALVQLRVRGYAGTSMLAIATAAGASKETLYRLFGDKAGLFAALVRHNAAAINADVTAALGDDNLPLDEALRRFAEGLVRLLLGERAIAINRAAIAEAGASAQADASARLGRILSAAGRETTAPLVLAYLEKQRTAGRLDFPSAQESFEVFLGLLLRDRQVRALLGVLPLPSDDEVKALAERAVAYFLRLFAPASPR